MLNIILIIGLIAAALIIGIILIQNPKGGGLASNFSSSNQMFGVQRTSEGVEKLTWIFAAVILVVSLVASSYNGASTVGTGKVEAKDAKINELINAPAAKGNATPSAPATQQPAQQQPVQQADPAQQQPTQ
jgi:preprotein translocase subunit SecG